MYYKKGKVLEIGLREKKKSQSKIRVLQAFTVKLKAGEPFQDISIKEVCLESEISEASFYNYFPQKKDLLAFMIRLWQLGMIADVLSISTGEEGLEFIKNLFFEIVANMQDDHSVLFEALSFVSQDQGALTTEVSDYEVSLAYPDKFESILKVKNKQLPMLVYEQLMMAQKKGELIEGINLQLAASTIMGTLIKGPMMAKGNPSISSKDIIKFNLEVVINGLRKTN